MKKYDSTYNGCPDCHGLGCPQCETEMSEEILEKLMDDSDDIKMEINKEINNLNK